MTFLVSNMPVPDLLRHPIDWLLYRLTVASEFRTIEWWYWDNLVFVAVLVCLIIAAAIAVALRSRRRRRV
jgi:hypothetical protein